MPAFETLLIGLQHSGVYAVALFFFAAYPIVSSLVWVTTSLFFVLRWERDDDAPAPRDFAPPVSVLVPAHNEESMIAHSLAAICNIDYPDYEILVVNDGSSDATVQRVLPFVQAGRVRLLDKRVNEGKALALNDALPMLQQALDDGRDVHFIHCARHGGVHAFRDWVDALAERHPKLKRFYVYSEPRTEDSAHGEGFITREHLAGWLPEGHGLDAYFLGPKPFMARVKSLLGDLGVPAGQAHYEFFGPASALEA